MSKRVALAFLVASLVLGQSLITSRAFAASLTQSLASPVNAGRCHRLIFTRSPFVAAWPELGFSTAGERCNPYESAISPSSVSSLTSAWTYTTGASIDTASPVEINGIVYIGSNDDKLYALNAKTGALKWSALVYGAVQSAPAVANGVVYVRSSSGMLFAFNASTGAPLWKTSQTHIVTSPTVAGGIIYVGADDGLLQAYNASTGVQLWSVANGNPAASTPMVSNNTIYVGSGTGNLNVFAASDGKLLWSGTTQNPVFATPAVVGGIVYVTDHSGVTYAFSAGGAVARPAAHYGIHW